VNISVFLEDLYLIRLAKTALFICGMVIVTGILIPRGVKFYCKWKETANQKALTTAIIFLFGEHFFPFTS
jgi:hypothetical protein